jgi:hypothetical protein
VAFALLLGGCGGGAKHDLSEQQLSLAVEAQRPSLERCYQSALETSPYKQEIRMQAVIHIAPTGAVSGVELDGNGGLPGMSPCLRKAIAAWHFPEAADATHTSLPLIFQPQVQKAQPDPTAVQEAVRGALSGQRSK